MRTILLAAAVLAATLTPGPAHAATHGHSIRYVSLNACDGSPCGPWTLSLHNGAHLRLPDAQVRALSKRGKPIKGSMAPIGVNGNGTRVAYLRASDGRLVVRDIDSGVVHPMPWNVFPKGVSQQFADLRLSLDGGKLAVSRGGRARLYDVASASHLSTLPKGQEFLGFSGDGDEALTRKRDLLYSHTLGGRELARSKVKSDGPFALNADGVTVAYLTESRGKGRAVLWDLVSDRENVRTWVWVPDYRGIVQLVDMLDWTADRQLTMHIADDAMRSPYKMHVLRLDLATSRFTLRDRFAVRANAYGFEACGG